MARAVTAREAGIDQLVEETPKNRAMVGAVVLLRLRPHRRKESITDTLKQNVPIMSVTAEVEGDATAADALLLKTSR